MGYCQGNIIYAIYAIYYNNYNISLLSKEGLGFLSSNGKNLLDEFNRNYIGTTKTKSRKKQCMKKIGFTSGGLLADATAHIYAKTYNYQGRLSTLKNMASNIKNVFTTNFNEQNWIGNDTKSEGMDTLQKVDFIFGFPEEIYDLQKVEKRYVSLSLNKQEYFSNVFAVSRLSKLKKVLNLRIKKKPTWRDATGLLKVKSYHINLLNKVFIGPGYMDGDIFDPDLPNYVNYASFGYHIGHLITRRFSDKSDIHSLRSNDRFKEKAKCFIEQYDGYNVTQIGETIDGTKSLSGNIGDTGGIINAYKGYGNNANS